MTCSETGTIRIATVAAISHLSSRWVPSRSFFKLFRVVDRGEDLVGADFLRVRLHHRIHELLHLRAVGEGDALQLAGLFQRGGSPSAGRQAGCGMSSRKSRSAGS